MKKIIIAITLIFSVTVSAQKKITEGKIISKQTMSTDNEQAQAQFDAIGEMGTVAYFKNKNSRSEIKNPATGDITTVINADKNEMLMLMDSPMLGKLYMLKKNFVNPEDAKNITVTKGEATKTILGYKCDQYIIAIDKDGVNMKIEMFTTEKIPVISQQTIEYGDQIKGFPLYVTIEMNQMGIDMKITTEVTSVQEEKVSEELFETTPPEGYKNMEEQ
ncbi:DUF4412 domain-containing protein [Kordia sp.]|uniref:DUF4412 domain-containing protein n=1 Tax=Kordia sp. TaxID=1965332 RepID=UPI003D2E1D28